MKSSVKAKVLVAYPKAIPGFKKDYKLRLPQAPPRDHSKEIPNVPTIVDRITCQHTPIAFHQDTLRQMSANQGP